MTVAGLTLERRLHVTPLSQASAVLLALGGALLVSGFLIAMAGASIWTAAAASLRGAFGDLPAVAETLVQSTPLVLTGLAVLIAFRARVWNIGAEGQFFAGAMAAIWVTLSFPNLPRAAMLFAVVMASGLGGAMWGVIPGFLKGRYGTNEVVVTVMMNFIILRLASYLLEGAWRAPGTFYPQTAIIPDTAAFPRIIPSSRLHIGFLIALIAAAVVFVLLRRAVVGYEIRAVGINARAARFRGINVPATFVLVMAIGGALAGLAGGGEVAGLHYRLRLDISTGYGFTGIIIALLARLHPVAVVFAAIFFGALVNGSSAMQLATGVPVGLVSAIQGLVLVFVLAADVLTRYQIRRATPRG